MALFEVDEKDLNVGSGTSNYLSKTGSYDCKILNTLHEVDSKEPKRSYLHLYLENNGQKQAMFYAIGLTKKDGEQHFQKHLASKLCSLAGIKAPSNPVTTSLPIGKGGSPKEVESIPNMANIPCTIVMALEYTNYKNKGINEAKVIKNVFRQSDKASTDEIAAHAKGVAVEFGSQYKKTMESLKTEYKDGLSKEIVDTWIRNGRGKGSEITGTINEENSIDDNPF